MSDPRRRSATSLLLNAFFAALLASLLTACATGPREPESLRRERAAGAPSDTLRERAAVLRAEDRRVVDDALRAAVDSTDPFLRTMAARALGRIGGPEAERLLPTLVADPSREARAAAIFGLGLLGGDGSFAAVATASADPEANVRIHAAAALALLQQPAIADPMRALLADPTPEVVIAACYAMASVREPEFAVDRLLELSSAGQVGVRLAAIHSLSRMAAEPRRLSNVTRRRVRQHLRAMVRSPIAEVRIQIARALNVPVGDDEAAALGMLSKDRDPRVRIAAASSFSFPGAPILPFLSETLKDQDERVVLASVLGLADMRGEDVMEVLAAMVVHDERQWLREKASLAMRTVDPDRAAGIARGLAGDEEPRIRLAAARLLAGRDDSESMRLAARLAEDDEPTVRRAAILALAGAEEKLSELLAGPQGDEEPAIRAAVASAVSERLEREGLAADDREDCLRILERLAERAVAGGDDQVLDEVVGAAGRFGATPRVRALLETGLGSRSHDVRRRAALHLGRLYDLDVSDRVGSPTERTIEEYVRILEWASVPRAAVVKMERPGFTPARFTLRLDTEHAPLTAWNFAELARDGFYDRRAIRRVVPNFVIQVGDPSGGWSDGPGYSIRDELSPAFFGPGTLAMASSGTDTAGSQWFVTLAEQPQLLGRYTVFGRVAQNLGGVVLQILPGDLVVSVEVYEGDGTEPLPALE